MKLTKQLQTDICNAWADQSASSCYWAMGQLSQFAHAVLEHKTVEIENFPEVISSLKSFLKWKKQTPGISEIPLLGNHKNLPDIINSMIEAFNIQSMALKSRDLNNRYYKLQLVGEGQFDIAIGGLVALPFPEEIINVINLRIITTNSNHYKLAYQSGAEKADNSDELKNEEIEFSTLLEII